MAMVVETYECNEVGVGENGAIVAATEQEMREREALLSELGIGAATETKGEVLPYRKIYLEEMHVYVAICPKQTPLASYTDAAIPTRVLQVAAHANALLDADGGKFFHGLYVWHPSTAVKDPVLVGYREKEDWYYKGRAFILARWGDELAPLAELAKKAAQIYRKRWLHEAMKLAAEVNSAIAVAERLPPECFMGAQMPYGNSLEIKTSTTDFAVDI